MSELSDVFLRHTSHFADTAAPRDLAQSPALVHQCILDSILTEVSIQLDSLPRIDLYMVKFYSLLENNVDGDSVFLKVVDQSLLPTLSSWYN